MGYENCPKEIRLLCSRNLQIRRAGRFTKVPSLNRKKPPNFLITEPICSQVVTD